MTQANLQIRVESSGMSEAERGLNNVARTGAKAEKATDNLAKSGGRVTSIFGSMGPRASQVSYQLQDIAVQAQSGTSAFTILGQQGSQMAAAFGPAGVVFGAVIALSSAIGGALYQSLGRASDGFADLEERVEGIVGKSLTAQASLISATIDEETKAIAELKKEIASIGVVNEQVSKSTGGRSRHVQFQDIEIIENTKTTSRGGRSGRSKKQAQDRVDNDNIARRTELTKQLTIHEEQLISLREKQAQVNKKLSGTEDSDKATQSLSRKVERIRKEGLTTLELETENHEEQLKLIDEYAAKGLASELEYNSLKENEIKRHKARVLEIERSGQAEARRLKAEEQRATEQLEKQVEQYRLSALDPVAREKENHLKRLAAIQQYQEQELGNEVEYNHLKEVEAERHAKAMAQITEKQETQKHALLSASQASELAIAGQVMGQLASLYEEGGKSSFDEYKAFASAQAAVSAALAVSHALATPPPLNVPLATSIGALAAVQIAKIQGMEYQGRAKGGQVLGGETYLVGERGPELLTMGNGNGHVTPNHQLGKGQSPAVNVTNVFQISAGVVGTVRAEIARLTPSIAKLTKQSVESAMREGGSMSRAMGMR